MICSDGSKNILLLVQERAFQGGDTASESGRSRGDEGNASPATPRVSHISPSGSVASGLAHLHRVYVDDSSSADSAAESGSEDDPGVQNRAWGTWGDEGGLGGPAPEEGSGALGSGDLGSGAPGSGGLGSGALGSGVLGFAALEVGGSEQGVEQGVERGVELGGTPRGLGPMPGLAPPIASPSDRGVGSGGTHTPVDFSERGAGSPEIAEATALSVGENNDN